MAAIGFTRFTLPDVLKEIGRPLLGRFFEPFKDELGAKNLSLPAAWLSDGEYYLCLAALLNPRRLPDRLAEALWTIEEMSTPEGHALLQRALMQYDVHLPIEPSASPEHVA